MNNIGELAVDVIKKVTVEGLVVKLPPGQLDRPIYVEVAKRMELIGGKWKGGKTLGFVFQQDPTDLLFDITNGQNRNLKKEFQFFATPDATADYLVGLADLKQDHLILEPSAGQGAIVKAIQRELPNVYVHGFELMPVNQTILARNPRFVFLGEDFLTECDLMFDRIIANPPFSKNQDILHIWNMWEHLKPGGRIVSVASTHWQHASGKKENAFRDWLDAVGADIREIYARAFKESGTNVATVAIIINKPNSEEWQLTQKSSGRT